MINVTNFERRSRFLVKTIAKKVRFDNETMPKYAYWTLYLDDNRRRPREVDTCATSYCISVLEAEKHRVVADGFLDKYIYHDIIQQAIRTLICIRGKNGAWPSVVEPRSLFSSVVEYSGEVAIGDNFFALTALFDVGFLNKQFEYTNDIPDELLHLEGRIRYICQTIDWLIHNRAIVDEEGWYYTNTKSNESRAVSYSTASILLMFNNIRNAIKGMDEFRDYYDKLENIIKSTNEYFIINIRNNGGIGKVIESSSTQSSLLHTCKMVDALLLSEDTEYNDEIEKAVSFIIEQCQTKPNCDFKSEGSDFYSENYNLMLPSGDEITIRHENFIEGVLLYTLINILIQCGKSASYVSKLEIEKSAVSDIVYKLLVQLEDMQTKQGEYNGLFKCHVTRSEGIYPVYASFEGYRAFRMYMSLGKNPLTESEKAEIKDLICKNNPFDPNAPYIFISYAHVNDDVVIQDVQRLKKQFNCWIDFENLDGGRCRGEDDWTKKVKPVLQNENCKGVIMYISKDAFYSNGFFREAEWITNNHLNFYTFLVGFSDTITPKEMATIIADLQDTDTQLKLRRMSAFTYVSQANKDVTEFSYYHRDDTFSHLSYPDFYNWIRRIELM